jgi:hypothetical protein
MLHMSKFVPDKFVTQSFLCLPLRAPEAVQNVPENLYSGYPCPRLLRRPCGACSKIFRIFLSNRRVRTKSSLSAKYKKTLKCLVLWPFEDGIHSSTSMCSPLRAPEAVQNVPDILSLKHIHVLAPSGARGGPKCS